MTNIPEVTAFCLKQLARDLTTAGLWPLAPYAMAGDFDMLKAGLRDAQSLFTRPFLGRIEEIEALLRHERALEKHQDSSRAA